MKKLILGALGLVALLAAYALGSISARDVITLPPAEWAGDSSSAQAWREFAVSLESAGARVFERTEDPAERLEGIQYLAQLASAALEMKLAKGAVAAPRFTDWMSDYRKFLGDSPDAVYHTAQLSADYSYRITGNRGDAEYLGFMLYGKQLNGWNRAAANLAIDDMVFDEAGNFTLLLGKTDPGDSSANWLALDADIHMVMVRQYYHGRAGKQLANLNITALNAPTHSSANDGDIAAGLRAATTFFNETVDGAIALTSLLAQAPNSFDPPAAYSDDFGGVFYPTADNEYYGGWYNLAEDEALIIEGEVPDAPYWGLSLQNMWMQSLDYEQHQAALNGQQIVAENNRYRVVVSATRPSSGNWLDTGGKPAGLLTIRYQRSTASQPPTLKLVSVASLREEPDPQ